MKPIELAEIDRIVHATTPPPHDKRLIRAVCTDTRHMQPDSLFVALRGERFDGHDFLEKARAGGAIAALVDRRPAHAPPEMRLVRVADTRAALGLLARHARRQLRGKVIAVAGSNGKTGTKRLIAAALGRHLKGSISPRSFNNDIGVPLAILPADPHHDYLVLEIGTNHPGEIHALTRIALPDIAVITNCSAEHLEGLGDVDGVRRENADIIHGIPPNGLLIVNGDDPALLAATADFTGSRVTFGFSPENDLHASHVLCGAQGVEFRAQPGDCNVFVPLLGRHSACNTLAAIAVARVMGLADREIFENLKSATAPEMRLQLQDAAGVRILNDAYNANPASMKAALQTLAALETTGRRVAVVGDMRELGPTSPALHREIGRMIAGECRPDWLVCVGSRAQAIAEEALRAGMHADTVDHFPDAQAAAAIAEKLSPGDLVLLKASRAVRLELVNQAIVASRAGCAAPS